MQTSHKLHFKDSRKLDFIENKSIDLIVTSPPYPMIQMWDELFFNFNPDIKNKIEKNKTFEAFQLMHEELNKVWLECYRVLKNDRYLIINIADATRTLNKNYELFTNHTYIMNFLKNIGFSILPYILWRKICNAKNNFMGSATLPSNAYVTLEHEYIIIARKGGLRKFNNDEKVIRSKSSIFYEERNSWYSDHWSDIVGIRQDLKKSNLRSRSAAYPFNLVYRLINMHSIMGDTVLDPFLGTGTTMSAALTSNRNSIGVEIDENFKELIFESCDMSF